MGKIKLLDKIIANKINAGEVITEPLGVVKELVENSIDAGSTEIEIEIRNAGLDFIRVKDNGCGIPYEDTKLLFSRHATSKITEIKDIYRVSTFGFRGEALASIASVSKVNVTSRYTDEMQGFELITYGGRILMNKKIFRNVGSTFTVEDLFYNTPVRANFLKNASSLERNIIKSIGAIAIGNENISFKLFINDKLKLFTEKGKLMENLLEFFGEDMYTNLVPISFDGEDFSAEGFITDINYSYPNRNNQFFYVNNRLIYNQELLEAVSKAFKGLLPYRRYPGLFLKITTPFDNVDVNVHPRKLEVRFNNNINIVSRLKEEIRPALYSNKKFNSFIEVEKPKPLVYTNDFEIDFTSISYSEKESEIEKVLESVPTTDEKKDNFDIKNFIAGLKYKGQIFNTYLIFESDNEMVLMDQHAAHEKILFEKFLELHKNKKLRSKILLVPFTMSLSVSAYNCYKEKNEMLKESGFEIEDFGDNTIVIRGVPHVFEEPESRSFLLEMLEGSAAYEYDLYRVITASCKAAIKAHDKLDDMEVDELLYMLGRLNDPFTCPHGRPIITSITNRELENKFERS